MNLQRQIKHILQEISWSFLRHEKSERDICLFASRRGGSTWLQEVICTNNGIRYVDQPFSFYSGPPFLHEHLPLYSNSVFIHLDHEDKIRVKKYLNGIFSGKIVHSSQWRFWKKSFLLKSNRVLLKITKGKPLIEWIADNYDVDVIYLIRHPISQSLSVLKAGWENDSKVYLQNSYFTEKFLNPELVKFSRHILGNGKGLEKFVLNWCLESLIPFKGIRKNPHWILISYEECVTKPDEMVAYLSEKLALTNWGAMKKQIVRPSRTTKFTNQNIKNVSWRQKLYQWQKSVSKDEQKRCFEILKAFNIDLYPESGFMPDEKYLIFSSS